MKHPSWVKTFTGVLYVHPELRPTCVTTPKPGRYCARGAVRRFVNRLLKRAMRRARLGSIGAQGIRDRLPEAPYPAAAKGPIRGGAQATEDPRTAALA